MILRCAFRLRTVSRTSQARRRWIAVASLTLLEQSPVPCGWAQSADATKDAADDRRCCRFRRARWCVDAAANELVALHHKDSYLRYRMETVNEKGEQVRDVIESKDGTVARLIMKDGKPLTAEQDKAERQRLNDMIASPAAYFEACKEY